MDFRLGLIYYPLKGEVERWVSFSAYRRCESYRESRLVSICAGWYPLEEALNSWVYLVAMAANPKLVLIVLQTTRP